jgi:hypothetical protein
MRVNQAQSFLNGLGCVDLAFFAAAELTKKVGGKTHEKDAVKRHNR